jgi:hypothetical protein
MFKGKAELIDPEKGDVVASFNETCRDDGTALVSVRLKTPITLKDEGFLAIVASISTAATVISVAASDPAGTVICEFHGKSAIGCVADGSEIALVKSPGGPLGTLLEVVGKGKVQKSY